MAGGRYSTIDFTETFLTTFSSRDFSAAERKLFLEALRLLDQNERHPSLRVHQLHGDRGGSWSASASRELRVTFERLPDGRYRMLTCARHYVVESWRGGAAWRASRVSATCLGPR